MAVDFKKRLEFERLYNPKTTLTNNEGITTMNYSEIYNNLVTKLGSTKMLATEQYRRDFKLSDLEKMTKGVVQEAVKAVRTAVGYDMNAVTLVFDKAVPQDEKSYPQRVMKPSIMALGGQARLYDGRGQLNKPVSEIKGITLQVYGASILLSDDSELIFNYVLKDMTAQMTVSKLKNVESMLKSPTSYIKDVEVGEYKVNGWKLVEGKFGKDIHLDTENGIVICSGYTLKVCLDIPSCEGMLIVTGKYVTQKGNTAARASFVANTDDSELSLEALDFLGLSSGTNSTDDYEIDLDLPPM